MVMLLCASKFATAKFECSFEIGKYVNTLGVPFTLSLMVHLNIKKVYKPRHNNAAMFINISFRLFPVELIQQQTILVYLYFITNARGNKIYAYKLLKSDYVNFF